MIKNNKKRNTFIAIGAIAIAGASVAVVKAVIDMRRAVRLIGDSIAAELDSDLCFLRDSGCCKQCELLKRCKQTSLEDEEDE